MDQYNFSPAAVLEKVTLEQYITFAIYCLEYRSLLSTYSPFPSISHQNDRNRSIVLEQLSEQREREALAKLVSSESDSERAPSPPAPYGVLVHTCVIRDLGHLP